MHCPKCGKEIEEGTQFCKYCGEKLVSEAVKEEITKQPKTSGLAIASLVLGILFVVPFAPLLAIVFGIIALRIISKSKGELTGKGMAIAGLALGGLVIILGISIWLPKIFGGRVNDAFKRAAEEIERESKPRKELYITPLQFRSKTLEPD